MTSQPQGSRKITITTDLASFPEITVDVLGAVVDGRGYAWFVYEDHIGVHAIRADASNVKAVKRLT